LAYLNCTRCQLSIEERRGRPALDDCPRCLARLGARNPLFRSRLPLRLLRGTLEETAPVAPPAMAGRAPDIDLQNDRWPGEVTGRR
jgi:hypothetical protein